MLGFKRNSKTKPKTGSAAAVSGASSSHSDGDRGFLNELYELLDREAGHRNVVIQELILEQWQQLGDGQMALGVAQDILEQDPSHPAARAFVDRMEPSPRSRRSTAQPVSSSASSTSTATPSQIARKQPPSSKPLDPGTSAKRAQRAIRVGPAIQSNTERQQIEADLERKYTSLMARASELDHDLAVLEPTGLLADRREVVEDTRNIKGGFISLAVMPPLPRPIRQLVRELAGDRQQCLQLVVDDFVQVARWALDEDQMGRPPTDVVRKRLLQRQTLLDAMLPPELAELGSTAMRRVEHQLVHHGKTYANSETMLGDDVADIPPANLVVTDDNYAWDMSELADALTANNGVMRNPLTKDMFSEQDVHQILHHPLGSRLRPMALEQSQLKSGVRPDTIERLAALSKVMLEDQSAHATPTISAIDNFLAYCSTLPSEEQKALQSLKVPARDSYTRKEYDSAILEAVKDAKGNRVCYHKSGDFLGQAAKYLRESS